MTAAAISIGTGGAGIPPAAGSGNSLQTARGAQAGGIGNSETFSGSVNETNPRTLEWQRLLHLAGVTHTDSVEQRPDAALADANAGGALPGSKAGSDPAPGLLPAHGFFLTHGFLPQTQPNMRAAPAPTAAPAQNLEPSSADVGAHEKTGAASNGSQSSNAKAGHATLDRKDGSKSTSDATAANGSSSPSAQALLASFSAPVAVPVQACTGSAAHAALGSSTALRDGSDEPGKPAVALQAKAFAVANATGELAQKEAAGHDAGEQEITAKETAGLHSAAQELARDGSAADASFSVTASRAASNASAQVQPAPASGAAADARNAAQSGMRAAAENPNLLGNAAAPAATASSPASGTASDASQRPLNSLNSSAASGAHARASSNHSTSANPAQGQGSGAGISAAAMQPLNRQAQTFFAAGNGASNDPNARGASGIAGASTSGTHTADPFSSLDSGASTDSTTWIHAGPHSAEAGFQDPSLGWVGVRAEAAGGAIQAAVVPSSNDAAQALGSHLAGLHAYLSDHHALAGAVTMARPESWSGSGQSGGGQGLGQGSGQSSGQGGAPMYGGSSSGQETGTSPQQTSGMGREAVQGINSRAVAQAATLSHRTLRGGGLISVVA